MTRKRFMKLMMGKGVSRNVAREVVKTMQGMKATEDLQKHYVRIGKMKEGALLGGTYAGMKFRLCGWLGVSIRQQQAYTEKSKLKSTLYKV